MTDEQRQAQTEAIKEGSKRPFYAGRWVCQKDARRCYGYFTAKDVGTFPCPLAAKCLNDKHSDGQLERVFKRSQFGKLICGTSSLRSKEHQARAKALRAAFFPEKVVKERHECYVRTRKGTGKTGGRFPRLNEVMHGYVPMNARKSTPPPPCGGDCENCPFDECRYPDWDEEHSRIYVDKKGGRHSREVLERKWKKERDAIREKAATDPVFREFHLARCRRYNEKCRNKVRFVKAGGSPEQFEALWAEAGGDPEAYKKLLKRKGE